VSYCLGYDADEQRPSNILAADRNMSNFDFTGLPDNINCYIISSPSSGAYTARWSNGRCHGANIGMLVLSDGSGHRYDNPRLVPTLLGSTTDDGTLQFFFP